jgi:hypothetical protein
MDEVEVEHGKESWRLSWRMEIYSELFAFIDSLHSGREPPRGPNTVVNKSREILTFFNCLFFTSRVFMTNIYTAFRAAYHFPGFAERHGVSPWGLSGPFFGT